MRVLTLRTGLTCLLEVSEMDDQEVEKLISDLLEQMPEEVRNEVEDEAGEEGKTLEDYLRMMVTDMNRGGLLDAARDSDVSEDEFIRMMLVGDCPNCGSENTMSCDELEGVEDPTLARCAQCGYTWCLECGSAVTGETCEHWQFCDRCEEEKDEFGDCGIFPAECPHLLEWLAGNFTRRYENACAWCGREIGEEAEVFGVGAAVRGNLEFTSKGDDMGFLMPVMIQGRLVPAIVTAPGSEARLEGNDLLFMTCSEECAGSLRDALREEKELIDRAERN